MDTIGDMLTIIINAQRVRKERVAVPYSKFKEQLARLLMAKGLVSHVRVQEGNRAKLVITLAYKNEIAQVGHVVRLSKPGRRWYVGHSEIPYQSGPNDMYVISTSDGLLDGKAARAKGLGGELICRIGS